LSRADPTDDTTLEFLAMRLMDKCDALRGT
jgi:hypothetical protein